MKATAISGVWKEEIKKGYTMLVDTNHNIVTVKTPNNRPLRYEIPEGITIDDVVRIREEVIKNYNL
jgi:hypothetical protein